MTIMILTTMLAAFVTGGLGYGFSSITVPVALFYYSNRILNPALVILEVGININSLWLNKKSLTSVWKRLIPIVIGLVPAVIIGSFLLKITDVTYMKLVTYCFLAPLILLQSLGYRKPLSLRRRIGGMFGVLIGLLYSLTTISGPPLAVALNNDRFEKEEFRAAMGIIRTIESSTTLVAYFFFGIFNAESLKLFMWIAPGVIVSMFLGAYTLSKLDSNLFRRICISMDVWIIAFGLTKSVIAFKWLAPAICYMLFVSLVTFDAVLFFKFIRRGSLEEPVKKAAC